MIGDIIVIVVCLGIVLVFREIDKQNRSFEKIKKFSDKILADFGEYFKSQTSLIKNSGIELDVKQSQAVAAVERFEETIEEFERRSTLLTEKLSIVDDIEKRLELYNSSINDLFEMTERVEENLEKIRSHSNLVHKVSNQLDTHEKQLEKIEKDIPNIIINLEKLNEEKMNILGSDFSAWVEQRTADLQTLADAAVDKNEQLLDEIKQVYDQSLVAATEKVSSFEDEAFETLRAQTMQRTEEFEDVLSRNSKDLQDFIDREVSELEKILNTKLVDAVKDQEEKMGTTLQNYNENTLEELTQIKNSFDSELSIFADAVKDQQEKMNTTLQSYNENILEELTQTKNSFDSELSMLDEKTIAEIARQKEELSSFESNFTRAQEMIKNMDETVLSKQAETKELVDRLQYHLESNASELANMLDEKIESYETEFEKIVAALRLTMQKQTDSLSESMDERCNVLQGSFDSRLDEIDSVMNSLRDEVLRINNEKTTEFFLALDAEIKEARKDAEYRLERINSVGKDIDNLDVNFRRLIEIAEQRINTDFDKFREEANTAQHDFEAQSNESFAALKEGLDNINTELNNLKERAYENVSEKLQLFEDDFFSDLGKRSEAMSESMIDWHQDFDGQLAELKANVEKSRLVTESKFAEDMKEHIAATQDRYREQINRLEESMKSTEGEYVDRLQQIEANLHAFLEEQRNEFEGAKADSEEYFKSELNNYGDLTSDRLKRFERELAGQLSQLEQTVSTAQEETSGSLEGLLAELTSWRERLDTQFQENKDMYTEKFEILQQNAREQISQVEQVFSGDVANYINKAKEERDSISVEINDLKEQTQSSLSLYEARSEEMLDGFRKAYEAMLEDTQKRIRGENTDAEQRVRALKTMVQEVRQESEDMQEKMVLKIQTEANLLKMSMDDVDKKLKQFVAQTQLFEKTDEMKNELENQMSDLRTQLTRFENFKQVTDSIESQFSKIRKLDDETINRMQRLSAEKNRIDSLESDFSKLITLSGSMDQKITDLKSTNDELQILQVEVRRFQETLGEISSRYDRLEKKSPVLDQTMTDIDKTFENLREIEDRLAACAQDTMEIPETVGNLKSDISSLLEHSRSIADVMDKLQDLDSVLANTTKQVAVVEKARDGIVKVESRLTDMIKEAKDQVNLYKAVKEGGKKNDPGAPPIAVRENVIKLAHQGWKSEQIAQSLNLPRGEVELILDFYGSQNR